MGYRDDVVVRLQENGLWDQLTGEQQQRFLGLSDEQARQILVMDDDWDMGEQHAIKMFGVMSLVKMIGAFNGSLVQRGTEQTGKLSKAGRLLAEFFLELKQRGMTPDLIDQHLQDLNPLVIAALLAAYENDTR
jgi:hypothetical protein